LMHDLDPAKPEMVAGAEGVDVEALSGPHIAEACGQKLLGAQKVRARGHLEIPFAAGDEADGKAGALGHGGVVRKLAPARGAVCGKDGTEAKALRRLRSPEMVAIDSFENASALAAFHRVAHGKRGNGTIGLVKGGEHAVDRDHIEKRPCRIVDEDAG